MNPGEPAADGGLASFLHGDRAEAARLEKCLSARKLRQLTSVLAAVFAIVAVVKAWLGREEGLGLILIAAGSAVFLVTLRVVLAWRRVPDQLIYPLLMLVELVGLAGTFASFTCSAGRTTPRTLAC